MKPETQLAIAELDGLSVDALRAKYEEVFDEECRSRHRRYLLRRIAWRLQVNDEGGLSPQARQRAKQLAMNADVRVTAPSPAALKKYQRVPPHEDGFADWDPRLPPPGNYIERVHRGRTIRVLVLTDGFEFEGRRYRSLTAIAKEVTGSSYNGFVFFRLGRKPQ
ncbi:DUF2924 domain-containing protein [Crateriforma spongiae]|uniref:DUF2924 domain-containing protein n=1 Tax=Crateriforma spongiae TaxID=2724528 RepID=UPI0039B002E7